MSSDELSVVFDSGSQNFKAGFAGDNFPRAVFSSVVGRFRKSNLIDGFSEIYCGTEAIRNRGISDLTWPVVKGLVENWDDIEKIWHHAFFKQMYAAPDQCRLLYSLNPLTPDYHKEKIAEILFETFNIRGLFVINSPALVLHASGRTSGLVWESGASTSYAIPIYEGFPLYHAVTKTDLCGDALSSILRNELKSIGYSFTTPAELDIVENIKKTLCYVSKNYEDEFTFADKANVSYELPDGTQIRVGKERFLCTESFFTNTYLTNCQMELRYVLVKKDFYAPNLFLPNVSYELPDGTQIRVGKERFLCTESFFNPSLAGFNSPNIVDTIVASIDRSELDLKPMLYENIVIGGGNTMFAGLEERLIEELSDKVNKMADVRAAVDAISDRQHSAWLGGSILSSLSSMKDLFMTSAQYDDIGPHIVHKYLS